MFTETFNRKNDYYPSYSRKKYEEVTIVYDRPFTTATINGYYYDISKAFNCLYPGITDDEGFEKIVDKYKLNFPDTISVKSEIPENIEFLMNELKLWKLLIK